MPHFLLVLAHGVVPSHYVSRYFKLVVYAVEKFIHKARSDFKVPGL
jgi:hypothetical protein